MYYFYSERWVSGGTLYSPFFLNLTTSDLMYALLRNVLKWATEEKRVQILICFLYVSLSQRQHWKYLYMRIGDTEQCHYASKPYRTTYHDATSRALYAEYGDSDIYRYLVIVYGALDAYLLFSCPDPLIYRFSTFS